MRQRIYGNVDSSNYPVGPQQWSLVSAATDQSARSDGDLRNKIKVDLRGAMISKGTCLS